MIEIKSLEDFKIICANNIYLVVDIYADWCIPCRAVSPLFEEMAKKYHGKCSFVKLNVDVMDEESIPLKYPGGVPCFVFIKNGQEVEKIRVHGGNMKEIEENLLQFLKN